MVRFYKTRTSREVLFARYNNNKNFWFRGNFVRILKYYNKIENKRSLTTYLLLSDGRIIKTETEKFKEF